MRSEEVPTIGWSGFARLRNIEGFSHFTGTDEELVERVKKAWEFRYPGQGRHDCSQVVIVPVDPHGFESATVSITEASEFHAELKCRQDGEDFFIEVTADGPKEKTAWASVVLYSKQTLEENGGQRSTDCDWEIVALVASSVSNEPMTPLTMARNMLEKPGGTYCEYTAKQFADSIWYWSKRCKGR